MPYPWPSFGGFVFRREEHIIWGTDVGWAESPSYSRQRPFGSETDSIISLAIGSAERQFEINLTPTRMAALRLMLNARALLTDWARPTPDSRMAFLTEITPLEEVISFSREATAARKYRVRLAFVSA